MGTTRDLFLSGKIRLTQPAQGYRAAIDPVLLAAACPALPGQTILDAGCGVGTAALCAMARAGCGASGLELQPHLAELATLNAADNLSLGSFQVSAGSILSPPNEIARMQFDHVICNPPYLPRGYGHVTASLANHESDASLGDWVAFAIRRVKDGGSVVFIHRADRLAELLSFMPPRLGALAVLPLWPQVGKAARRVIVGGIKARKTPLALLPGLALHDAAGLYTAQSGAILRGDAAIDLWS